LSQGTPSYNLLESGYWSNQQAEVDPHCVFLPSDSVQVAVALLLSRLTQCPFAIKSGGHAAFAGASNIQGGVTINFAKLGDVVLSSEKNIASVGPGNTWFDVYKALEPENLTVIGGRVAAIGVGGLTLGGKEHGYQLF
jgi:FAD/FMN-containing dehydrogenase